MSKPPKLYAPKELAHIVGVSVRTVQLMVQTGRLRGEQAAPNHAIRIAPEDARRAFPGAAALI